MKHKYLGVTGLLSAVLSAVLSLSACAPKNPTSEPPVPTDEPTTVPVEPEQVADLTVTILSTNDMHGNLTASESAVGIAQAAAIADSNEHSILVDGGDALQGASFATLNQGADVIRAMNAAGYDAMVAGNHDFDYGTAKLLENAELADFPILSANAKRDGEAVLQPSTIFEFEQGGDSVKIGVIGLTTTDTAQSTNALLLDGVTFEDEIACAKAEIAAVRDRVDQIVLLCHLGDNADAVECTSEQLLGGLSEEERSSIAAVIDGHSHSVENASYYGVPTVQAGVNCGAIAEVQLTFHMTQDFLYKKIVARSSAIYAADGAPLYELTEEGIATKERTEAALSAIQAEQDAVLDQTLCENPVPLWGGYVYYDYVESRIVETPFGDFVTDAFAYYAQDFAKQIGSTLPVVGIENGGGIAQTLPGGTVTYRDVLSAFNHGNVVEVLEVTPADLYAVLENGLAVTAQDAESGLLVRTRVSGSFIQCSGFSYTYQPAGAAGEKVTAVVLANGDALDRTDTESRILLATNNYVSTFFQSAKKIGELGGEDAVITNYIELCTENGTKPLVYTCSYDRILLSEDCAPDTYTVTLTVKSDSWTKGTAYANETVAISVDSGAAQTYTTDAEGRVTLTLAKGAHTLTLAGSADFVYVNNYSGSGTVTTRDGYYYLGFVL